MNICMEKSSDLGVAGGRLPRSLPFAQRELLGIPGWSLNTETIDLDPRRIFPGFRRQIPAHPPWNQSALVEMDRSVEHRDQFYKTISSLKIFLEQFSFFPA